MKTLATLLFLLYSFSCAHAQAPSGKHFADVVYVEDGDAYRTERCRLDLYIPQGIKDFVTVIWYHGGGLTGGEREIPSDLKDRGIAIVGVGYRLSPKAKVSEIISDAADAVKWTMDHIEAYGGSKNKIVLAGHSAGAYLALMLALDSSHLARLGLSANDLLGVVSLSAQTITHFTARAEQGIAINQPTIDKLAPLFWVRKDAPRITLITGDRELEMVGRYEENAYLARMLKITGHPQVKLLELDGFDHGMTYPAFPLLLKEIAYWSK